jgi:glycosyltransferase involved in cell wall biosynthesis
MIPLGVEARIVLPRPQQEIHPDVLGVLDSQRDKFTTLCNSVEEWAPDIVHVQFAISGFGTRFRILRRFLRALRNRIGVPVVVTLHEVTRETAALGAFGRMIYRALVAQCDRVIVHTRAARSALTDSIGVLGDKVDLIPHPEATPPGTVTTASELRNRFNLDKAELLVAFGFIHVDKGLDDFIRALRILNSSANAELLSNVRIVIAGTVRPRQGLFRIFELRDQWHLRHVLQLAERANLLSRIVLTGYVPEADVAGWFQAAAGIVLPYKKTEQSGVAALANSFGIPVLATTVGGLGEQYEGSRWLFPPRNPEALARVLVRFLSTPGEREADLGTRPTADLGSIVKITLDLYETTAWPSGRSPQGRTTV